MQAPPGAVTHRHHLAFAGVDDAQGLVLAGGGQQAANVVPAHTVDDVGVHVVQTQEHFPSAHVPDEDHVVTTCPEWPGIVTVTGVALPPPFPHL